LTPLYFTEPPVAIYGGKRTILSIGWKLKPFDFIEILGLNHIKLELEMT